MNQSASSGTYRVVVADISPDFHRVGRTEHLVGCIRVELFRPIEDMDMARQTLLVKDGICSNNPDWFGFDIEDGRIDCENATVVDRRCQCSEKKIRE